MKGEAQIGDYKLAFDFNALCLAEEYVGPLGLAMGKMGEGSLTTVRALLWAGLRKYHPEITLEGAGLIVQEIGFDPVSEPIAEGINSAFSKAPKGKKTKAAPS